MHLVFCKTIHQHRVIKVNHILVCRIKMIITKLRPSFFSLCQALLRNHRKTKASCRLLRGVQIISCYFKVRILIVDRYK